MTLDRHLLALRHEGDALADAARRGLKEQVPSCPGWDVARLVEHVGAAYRWATHIIRTHAGAEVRPDDVPGATGEDPIAAYEEALADLVETITNEGADAPCWNWSEKDLRVAFWARRMANETAVHRWDAQLAHGTPEPVEPDLAADGAAEAIDVFLPHYLREHPQDGLRGTFRVEATDTGHVWGGTLHPDHVEPGETQDPDSTVRGTASDLVLAFWGRDARVETSGDERIVGLLTE